jgi:hypothetical protein
MLSVLLRLTDTDYPLVSSKGENQVSGNQIYIWNKLNGIENRIKYLTELDHIISLKDMLDATRKLKNHKASRLKFRFMVFNVIFNNNTVISWRSVLFVEEIRVPEENHRPTASHLQTLSHNVVSSTPHLSWIRTHSVRSIYHTITTTTAIIKFRVTALEFIIMLMLVL